MLGFVGAKGVGSLGVRKGVDSLRAVWVLGGGGWGSSGSSSWWEQLVGSNDERASVLGTRNEELDDLRAERGTSLWHFSSTLSLHFTVLVTLLSLYSTLLLLSDSRHSAAASTVSLLPVLVNPIFLSLGEWGHGLGWVGQLNGRN